MVIQSDSKARICWGQGCWILSGSNDSKLVLTERPARHDLLPVQSLSIPVLARARGSRHSPRPHGPFGSGTISHWESAPLQASSGEGGMDIPMRVRFSLGATILFWSSSFPVIRIGLESYGPAELTVLRYAVASLLLIPATIWCRRPRVPTLADVPSTIVRGILPTIVASAAWGQCAFSDAGVRGGEHAFCSTNPGNATFLARFCRRPLPRDDCRGRSRHLWHSCS